MKTIFIIIFIAAFIITLLTTGCATEYYQPVKNHFTTVDGKIRGPVKREGFVHWSNGTGKNMPFSNISVIGK